MRDFYVFDPQEYDALENNKHIIHILQVDIFYDKNNWKNQLFSMINSLLIIDKPELHVIGIDINHFYNLFVIAKRDSNRESWNLFIG